MATEEWIRKAIDNGRLYDELPARVRQLLPVAEWKQKVKTHCHQRGLRWADSLAVTACGEQEYYEDLVRYFRQAMRVFPYHMGDYVCQILRITPFRYYCDLLFAVMRDEQSYDRIPNFTAADIVRVVGIGRNEFISIMNQCKAKKVLWRINKAIVKEFLPAVPLDIYIDPWWIAHVVNMAEEEFQELTPSELRVCRAIVGSNGLPAAQLPDDILQALHKRGLVYLDVPVLPTDHVSIPPLEGFVSNKDAEGVGDKGDPMEGLLYQLFVATSERADMAALAQVLSVDVGKMTEAVSIACRLGFGTNITASADPGRETKATSTPVNPFVLQLSELDDAESPRAGARTAEAVVGSAEDQSGGALAIVVDAEVTSFLMMGAMSPGLKRHSVSLFEGGRVTGHDVISDMVKELHLSVEAGRGFEGEMQRLSGYCSALARALETVGAAGGGSAVELLRKESLTSLAPAAAARVLAHSYRAVLPIAPLPFPPLPLSPLRPGPANFGATVEASTPWLQLVLYVTLRQGPPCLVMPAGQRLWRLPPPLLGATHVLVWPWSPAAVRAEAVPSLLPAEFLLPQLNEALTRTALLLQPLQLPHGELHTVDVPLPLVGEVGTHVEGIGAGGMRVRVPAPPRLRHAVQQLGLSRSLGYLRLLRVGEASQEQQKTAADEGPATVSSPTAASPTSAPDAFADLLGSVGAPQQPLQPQAAPNPGSGARPTDSPTEEERPAAEAGGTWVPLQLALGLPLVPEALNQLVCSNAMAVNFLEPDGLELQRSGQRALQGHLFAFIAEFGACGGAPTGSTRGDAAPAAVDLPLHNLLFDGRRLWQAELTAYLQGIGMLCFD